jgi:hypothetical protein
MQGSMPFRLVNVQYDRETERAYVELREADGQGSEVVVAVFFSSPAAPSRTKRAMEQDLARKARHLLRKASISLNGR